MRYILIGVVLLFIGCGSSNTTNSGESENTVVKPSSPITKDTSKQPPSIPNI